MLYNKKTAWTEKLPMPSPKDPFSEAAMKLIMEVAGNNFNKKPSYILSDNKPKISGMSYEECKDLIDAVNQGKIGHAEFIKVIANADLIEAHKKDVYALANIPMSEVDAVLKNYPDRDYSKSYQFLHTIPTAQIYYTLICLHDIIVPSPDVVNPVMKQFPVFIRPEDNKLDGKFIKLLYEEILKDTRFDELTEHNFEILARMRDNFVTYL